MKRPSAPWLRRGINGFGRLTPSRSPFRRPLAPRELIEEACRRTGLDDFGEPDLDPPLTHLVRSLEEEAGLSFLGRLSAHSDLLRLLVNRLALQRDRARYPGIAAERIARPLFITGLPRSGSTLLHQLLALDEGHRTPLTWEVRRPSPPPGLSAETVRGRIHATARELRWFGRLAPRFKRIHPLGACLPQECIEVLSVSLASPRFHTNYYVPSYQAWLDRTDQAPAYAWHRRFLQHLQWGSAPRRWVLKAPAHMFALEALLHTYPDATVVQTHRDPREVIGSMLSMTVTLQQVFSDRVDPDAVAAEVTRRWAVMMERAMRVRERAQRDSGVLFVDLQYADLVRAPLATVAALYRRLDLRLSAATRGRMEAWLRRHPQHRHGVHRYSLEGLGLDVAEAAAHIARCIRGPDAAGGNPAGS